jgi:hypothetical protein
MRTRDPGGSFRLHPDQAIQIAAAARHVMMENPKAPDLRKAAHGRGTGRGGRPFFMETEPQ